MRNSVSFLLGVFFVSNAIGALTLSELQKKLSAKRASWSAGDTGVSQLTDGEKRNRLGANFEADEESYFEAIESNDANPDALPEKLDWRNFEGKNWTTPVKDQGQCGSCLSFAATAVLESLANITYKNPNSPWSFSPQYAFACSKGICEEGLIPSQILKQLKNVGTVDESCMPYTSGTTGTDVACNDRCKDYKDRTFKIDSYEALGSFLTGTDTNKVKAALLSGPVLVGMMVYEDFYYYKSGVYKHVTGKKLGGHAVAIVGWENATKSWIVQNSWSPTWGENGFFRIAWKDSGIANAAYSMKLPTSTKYVAFENIRDYQVLSGKSKLVVGTNLSGLLKVSWSFSSDDKTTLDGAIDVKGNEHEVIVDTTQIADGTYTLTLAGQTRNGIELQQPKIISILNGKVTGKLNFDNVTVGQEFTDKIALDIRVESQPIRLSEVTFLAKNKATGETSFERGTTNVGPKMLMGLRKGALVDGSYDFQLHGSVNGKVVLASEPVTIKIKAKK